MRWLLAMPALGAATLIGAVELSANAGPAPANGHVVGDSSVHEPTRRAATALVRSASGSEVVGLVRFWDTADGQLAWDVELYGLTPGAHGFHVHAEGDCSAPDAASAGGHFDAGASPHGGPEDEVRHSGDLGNLVADPTGRAASRGVDPVLSLRGTTSVVGRSVVVHADPDDLTSQPAGASGTRVGCGVVRALPPRAAREEG